MKVRVVFFLPKLERIKQSNSGILLQSEFLNFKGMYFKILEIRTQNMATRFKSFISVFY